VQFEKTNNSGLFEAFFKEDKKQKSKLKASSYFGTIPKRQVSGK